MAMPLSPLSRTALNTRLPASCDASIDDMLCTPNKLLSPRSPVTGLSHRNNKKIDDIATSTRLPSASIDDEDLIDWDEGNSSPFVTEVQSELHADRLKRQGLEDLDDYLSPIREQDNEGIRTPFKIAEDETSTPTPVQQSTIKASGTGTTSQLKRKAVGSARSSPMKTPSRSAMSTKRVLLDNDAANTPKPFAMTTAPHAKSEEIDIGDCTAITFNEDAGIDDTCFSTFSEVPNTDMTMFAKLGRRSPAKTAASNQTTPRPASRHTPGTSRTKMSTQSRSPSPTPRQSRRSRPPTSDGDTTNLLLDFTQQFEAASANNNFGSSARTPNGKRSPSKPTQLLSYLQSQRSPTKTSHTPSTPGRPSLLNLLDFDLPPAPTPRSIPTITIRELESMKSTFASQISSLKASLSGREAEVESLKKAVGDAERRVGEAVESVRDEKGRREHIQKEKEDWERRGREFEEILRSVRTEAIEADKDRTQLEARLADVEERVRDAETRAEEAEARALQAATKLTLPIGLPGSTEDSDNTSSSEHQPLYTAPQVQQQIDEKVHALSTELHAIYKKKHVTKVAGLKKGLEAKSKEKQIALLAQIEELRQSNEDLQAKIDGTISGVQVLPSFASRQQQEEAESNRVQLETQAAVIEKQKAEISGRDSELAASRAEFETVLAELEQERVEKGELVAAVDEMLALQADASVLSVAGGSAGVVEDLRRSVGIGAGRPTGLRGPGFGAAGQQSRLVAPGMVRGASGGAGKSRMMSNIERMGGARREE